MNSMKFRRNLKNTMLISHKKPQERKKRVPLVELNPIYVKLDHFPPIFLVGEKCQKRIFEVSPHSNWLASPHSFGKRSFSRETFPKVRFHFELPGNTWDPVRGDQKLTWKPWVNGPILVGEEATDPTIHNQNLKGSLVDLKVGTLTVNIAVNGMFFRPCLIRVLFQISSDGFCFFLAGIDSLPCCRWNRPMSKAFRLKYECIHHPLQCKRTKIRVENEHF